MGYDGYEWDENKNKINKEKHGVEFADAISSLEDDKALTIRDDSDPDEEHFVTLGMCSTFKILVVVYTYRDENIRIISARPAEPQERRSYEENL